MHVMKTTLMGLLYRARKDIFQPRRSKVPKTLGEGMAIARDDVGGAILRRGG